MIMQESAPSISRALRGLSPDHQQRLTALYHRILPFLNTCLSRNDITERNRTWPGVSPEGKGATLLIAKHKKALRESIEAFAEVQDEHPQELHDLVEAYLKYGPIGLIEAIEDLETSLVPEELFELARFHRLGKHPRSDAGLYICEVLKQHAADIGLDEPPAFVSRYTFATTRRLKNWFFADDVLSEHVPKGTRRLNQLLPYPHQQWHVVQQQIPFDCLMSKRHQQLVRPWILTTQDPFTNAFMGFRLSLWKPHASDYFSLLRRSIWHYDLSWWSERGVPDILCLPDPPSSSSTLVNKALFYTHTTLAEVSPDMPLPSIIQEWLGAFANDLQQNLVPIPTIFELEQALLEYIQQATRSKVTTATSKKLLKQQVSLPWSSSIAAAGLLPSGGRYVVQDGGVNIYGVPFEVTSEDLNGKEVDVHYDLDDARSVYLIVDGIYVHQAFAGAFEGPRIPWIEIVDHVAELEVADE